MVVGDISMKFFAHYPDLKSLSDNPNGF